jgi:hypothetical protein
MTSPTESEPPLDLPWPEPPAPRAEISAAIKQHCTRDLCCRKGMSPRSRLLASLLLAVAVLGLLLVIGSGHARPEGALAAAIYGAVGWAVVLLAVLLGGLARPPGKRLPRRIRLAMAIGIPIAFLAYLAFAAEHRLPVGQFVRTGHAGTAFACGLHALLFSAIAAGGTLFIWRGTDPLTPGLSGALAGLAGGLAGAVAVGIACPSGETWHLWLAHGVALVALVALGSVAGRRWLAP